MTATGANDNQQDDPFGQDLGEGLDQFDPNAMLDGGERVPPSAAPDDPLSGSPVRPLGYDGERYWFVDTLGRCVSRTPRDFSPTAIASMFAGATGFLVDRFKPEGRSNKGLFDAQGAAIALINACGRIGPFDPNRARGPGVWSIARGGGTSKGLIINLGTGLAYIPPGGGWADRKWLAFGDMLEGHIYVNGPEVRPPSDDAADPDCVTAVKDVLDQIPWKDSSEVAVRVMLGALCLGYLVGAAPRRPSVAIEGELGSGKSQPLSIFETLLQGLADRFDNATYDAIRGRLDRNLGASYLLLDEFENQSKARGQVKTKPEEIIDLFRYAFEHGKGRIARGGGAAYDMTAHVAGLIAAIQIPAMSAASESRTILLRIDKSKLQLTPEKVLQFERLKSRAVAVGPDLFRLALDRVHDWPQVYNAYRSAAMSAGHDVRGADTYGSILAYAHLLAEDPEADLEATAAYWAGLIAPSARQSVLSTAEQCWIDFLSSPAAGTYAGGSIPTIRRLISLARPDKGMVRDIKAQEVLNDMGVTFVRPRTDDPERGARRGVWYVGISSTMKGVKRLFSDGPGADGGHARLLADLPGAYRTKHTINSLPGRSHCVCVPLSSIRDIVDASEGWEEGDEHPPGEDPTDGFVPKLDPDYEPDDEVPF